MVVSRMMSIIIILGVVLFISGCSCSSPIIISKSESSEINIETIYSLPQIDPDIVEDAKLTTPNLIIKYGYKAEVHYVTTEDGYILELHRIAGGSKSPARKGKKVAFLQHGLLDSSATWILTRPNHALGYLLADRDYDVWLGNSRGNTYSCNHTKYNPFGSSSDRKKFWSFSWHQIGIYDLPAMIDYVLNQTGQNFLQFIGHSQGTTAFYVMSSQKPEYTSKVKIMHALAPVAFMSHVESPPIRLIAPFVSAFETISSWLGIYDISPTNDFLKMAGEDMCRDRAVTQTVCENILFLIMGYTSDQLNATLLPVFLGHSPAGSATDQLLHYGQEVNSGHFRQFDFGYIKNLIHYKTLSPPDYNLKNVEIPIAIYYAQDDWLATVKDVERLVALLPNVVQLYLVPHKKFNHIDFLWGIDAPTLLYEAIFKVMNLTESVDFKNIIL